MSAKTEQYRDDVRKTFQSMSLNALHFQNARIPLVDCIDRQEIERELDRRDLANRTARLNAMQTPTWGDA